MADYRDFIAPIIHHRRPFIFLVNLVICAVGFWLSLGTRFEFSLDDTFREAYLLPFLLLVICRSVAYVFWNLNEGFWRYTSTQDVFTLVKAHSVSSLAFAASIYLLRVETFPRSVIFFEFVLSLMLSFGLRMVVRISSERVFLLKRDVSRLGREVVVLGAGDSGHLLIKTLLSRPRLGYEPVAVLDDSEHLQGVPVYGIKVSGKLSDLPLVLRRFADVSAVIVAIPSLSEARYQELRAQALEFSVVLKRLQSFEDIACLDASDPQMSPSIEAVLDKSINVQHAEEVHGAILGRTVLVTGAGGSIGSELARQLASFEPAHLVLLDNCEYNLFRIQQELTRNFPALRTTFHLGSICDEARLAYLFSEVSPEIVLHAAAYKHVPLLENNCYQAFLNNVVGTRNVLRVSLFSGVRRFVLISSDKAVDPTNVMGATKRVAEMLTLQACHMARARGISTFSAAAVRFGNVINSTGSVIPTFKEQIASGGPLTITHPSMERYFMSIREAVSLVLTAGALADSGEVYLLNMGKPIKIIDLARKMLALYGRRDLPIVFTGVRPGEKLTESLTETSELRTSTRFEKVSKVVATSTNNADAFSWVEQMERALLKSPDQMVSSLVRRFASPDSSSSNKPGVASA